MLPNKGIKRGSEKPNVSTSTSYFIPLIHVNVGPTLHMSSIDISNDPPPGPHAVKTRIRQSTTNRAKRRGRNPTHTEGGTSRSTESRIPPRAALSPS